jgi:hypothetical protein
MLVNRPSRPYNIKNPGIRGTHGARRAAKIAKRKEDIIRLREEGKSLDEICAELHTSPKIVKEVLFSKEIRADRLMRYNERLLARVPRSLQVIDDKLNAGNEKVAMWLLEATGTVSKEQVSLTINATNAVIPINQDMITAARMVADQMRVSQTSKLLGTTKEEPKTEVVEHDDGSNDVGGEGSSSSV